MTLLVAAPESKSFQFLGTTDKSKKKKFLTLQKIFLILTIKKMNELIFY